MFITDDLPNSQSSILSYQSRKKSEEKAKLKERRREIATKICAGICSGHYIGRAIDSNESLVKYSLSITDELIKQLDEDPS